MGNYTDEQAGNMRGLVKLMRRNLELTEQLCVTMAEELDFVNTFINLEREALGKCHQACPEGQRGDEKTVD